MNSKTEQSGFNLQKLSQILTSLPQHPRFVLAFSGGLDSTVLIHALNQIAKQSPELILSLVAVHIHHQLQACAEDWPQHCEAVCQSYNIPFKTLTVSVDTKGRGTEAAAREARYQALNDWMKTGDLLITAHHRDDQAETVLLNLFRGAGLHGLSAMSVYKAFKAFHLARPLLEFSKAELEAYAQTHQLHWLSDPSNTNTQYRRNLIRNHWFQELEKTWPAIKTGLARTAQHIRTSSTALDFLVEEKVTSIQSPENPLQLDLKTFYAWPPEVQNAVLRHWLRLHTFFTPSAQKLAEMMDLATETNPGSQAQIHWADHSLYRIQDRLWLCPRLSSAEEFRLQWPDSHHLTLPGDAGHLSIQSPKTLLALMEGKACFCQSRQGGERIKPDGHPHHRVLKKLLHSAQIPHWERARLPLLYCQDEWLAAGDIWISSTFKKWLQHNQATFHWSRPWGRHTMSSL